MQWALSFSLPATLRHSTVPGVTSWDQELSWPTPARCPYRVTAVDMNPKKNTVIKWECRGQRTKGGTKEQVMDEVTSDTDRGCLEMWCSRNRVAAG